MTKSIFKALTGSTAIMLSLSNVASADVTAQDVWDNWKSYTEGFGQQITVGNESFSGGTLTLQGLGISMDFPDGKMSGSIEMVEFRENGDGTVTITMSPDYPLAASVTPPEGDELDMTAIVRQTGMIVVASGTPDEISYDFSANQMAVDIDKLFVGGENIAPKLNIAMNDIAGQYHVSSADQKTLTSTIQAGSATTSLDMIDPTNGATVTLDGTFDNIAGQSSVTLPNDMDTTNGTWMFSPEFEGSGEYSTGLAKYQMSVENGAESFAINGQVESSTINFAMLDGVLNYGGASTGTAYEFSGAQIPFPSVELNIAESEFQLTMPMVQSDEPKEFGLVAKLIGLGISEDIWGMFDPTGQLPHDPATLIIDISGAMNWLFDLTDTKQAEALAKEGKSPAQLHAIDINDITLSVAGAEVIGNGAFEIDNTDTITWNGMPAPSGELNVNINGINVLMDNLTAMGFLPEEQAMGARMMLGMFARPANGEDALTSKIEVKEDGSVSANGQRIK